jgi:hypothetical protein
LNLAFKFAGTSHVTWHTYHITFSTGQGWIAAGITLLCPIYIMNVSHHTVQ